MMLIERRRQIVKLAILLFLLTIGSISSNASEVRVSKFVIFYGEDAPVAAFAPYQRIVLDADHHPPLAPLRREGVQIFGYLSLGEVEANRAYFADALQHGLLLAPNPDWPGARQVDLRKQAWRDMVIDRLVPAVLAQGFDGLFLDTLDDAATLEQKDAVQNAGMIEAASILVRAIHARFPHVPLMLNRAYEVGTNVAPELESVLAESLLSTYDFKTRRYSLRTAADIAWGRSRLAELKRLNPSITLFTLDYWNPADRLGVARLYGRERQGGFIPYVATIDLQQIVAEPVQGEKR